MLLFKDYFAFKKENKMLLEVVKSKEAYNLELEPILYVLDILSELNENNHDDDLDFSNVINIFEVGFNYLKIYLNYLNLFAMEKGFDIITEQADYISYYIEINSYLSYLHNEYSNKKLKHLSTLDEYADIVEDIIVSKCKPDLDNMRKTLVTILEEIEKDNRIEIPTDELYIPGLFIVLCDELENEEAYEF